MSIKPDVCVRIPDNRIGRVRDKNKYGEWRVRVKRFSSNTYQFIYFKKKDLKVVNCPQGWMTPKGYKAYLRKTLAKMRERNLLK